MLLLIQLDLNAFLPVLKPFFKIHQNKHVFTYSIHAIPVINFYLVVKLLCIISSISNNGTNDIYLADLPNVNF